jgi:CTD kinase subunit beta
MAAQAFEGPSKIVIGLERLMLESAGFDFRSRYPQKHLIKLTKHAKIEKDVAKLAYDIMLDLYRTFAPLKQTCATMSFACVELATLILEKQQGAIRGERSPSYRKWSTTRGEVVESILDLLDLYTHFQKSSIVGPLHNIEKFIQIRIEVNKELDQDSSLKRYTEFHEAPKTNGLKANIKTPKTPITPASPSDARTNGKDGASPATLSPRSSGSGRRGIGARGQEGTVRFMLDAEQAKQERETVSEYFKVEYEEYEVEVEEPIKHERDDRSFRASHRPNGRDDRSFHHKRVRMYILGVSSCPIPNVPRLMSHWLS